MIRIIDHRRDGATSVNVLQDDGRRERLIGSGATPHIALTNAIENLKAQRLAIADTIEELLRLRDEA